MKEIPQCRPQIITPCRCTINKSVRCKQDNRFKELLWTDKGERGTENHRVSISRRWGIKWAEGRGPGGTQPCTQATENRRGWRRPAPQLWGCQEGQRPPISLCKATLSRETCNKLRKAGQEGTKKVTTAAPLGENHLKSKEERADRKSTRLNSSH